MHLKNKGLLIAVAAIAVLLSFRAMSETHSENRTYDESAFNEAWSGEFYSEESAAENDSFHSFEEKKQYFLESSDVSEELIPIPQISPSPVPFSSYIFPTAPTLDPFRMPSPVPTESPAPSPAPSPVVILGPVKPQSFYYYNRGSLQNALQLDAEGEGYVKVFRDRDEKFGGRGWGTQALVTLVQELALEFSEKFPGRERLQIADMARRKGGATTHASHQTGLEADIIFIRKNRKEQPAFGGFGKNGFAEQFVISEITGTRTIRDSQGRKRIIHTKSRRLSSNFDMHANFELLLIASRMASVKRFFVDKVIIRELFRWAELKERSREGDVRSMLMKLDHQPSHADHFHLRLMCQESDKKCVSDTATARRRS